MVRRSGQVTFIVTDTEAGLRIDQALGARVEGLSRRRARVLLEQGAVYVDRKRVKVASRLLRVGQRVDVVESSAPLPDATRRKQVARLQAEDQERLERLRVIHEDADLVVVDKPAGVLSAPSRATDRGTVLSGLEPRLGLLHVVHRLDRPTSGLMVYARNRRSAGRLGDQLRERAFERSYRVALVGQIESPVLEVTTPIRGQEARTRFERRVATPDATLLDARLGTGRTHQIRIHAESLGHPVCGDRRYGREVRKSGPRAPRLALHAAVLGFTHPSSGERLLFESGWPEELEAWWRRVEERTGSAADAPGAVSGEPTPRKGPPIGR